MDPMKMGQMPLQGLPMTDEVAALQKKARLQAGQETTDLTKAGDVYEPSDAAMGLNRPGSEKFLDDIKSDIGRLDPNSETFLPDAASALIERAFSNEFGEEFTNDPGFPQMEAALTQQLLENPEYRGQVEQLLGLLTAPGGALHVDDDEDLVEENEPTTDPEQHSPHHPPD